VKLTRVRLPSWGLKLVHPEALKTLASGTTG